MWNFAQVCGWDVWQSLPQPRSCRNCVAVQWGLALCACVCAGAGMFLRCASQTVNVRMGAGAGGGGAWRPREFDEWELQCDCC